MSFSDPEKQREYDRERKAKARAEKKETDKKKDDRVRIWTFVAYPDSVPSNWEEILSNLHAPWVRSPLHDRDKNPNGEPKKPHWHIIISFEGKKSYNQVLEITKSVNGTIPEKVIDVKGYMRYFIHKDNPEKAQYEIDDIKGFCGFDYLEYFQPTTTESLLLQDEMIEWCLENNVTEFWVLKTYAIRHRRDWTLELSRSCFQICQYLKSRRHGADAKTYNTETGEQFF